jgi:hypothetical protein
MSERSVAPRRAFPVVRKLSACLFVVSSFCLAPSGLWLVGSAQATEPVYACGLGDALGAQNIFTAYSTFGINYFNFCGDGAQDGMGLYQDGVNSENPGQVASWYTTAPPGLVITNAVGVMSVGSKDVGTGYEAYFYWTGGIPQRVTSANGGFGWAIPNAPTFGFLLECNPSGTTCPPDGGPPHHVPAASIEVYDVQLTVAETVNPSVTALGGNNLWYKGASGYVRGGGWSVAYSSSAPSGIAGMGASEDGQPISDPTAPAPGCNPNHTEYQQCPGTQTWSPTIALSGNGPQPLTLAAQSAAGNNSSPTETIHVDSTPVAVSLSGPTQASSSAGTQYVTATATNGPSGLGAIDCAVDGGPAQSYKTSPASIPVSGLGNHSVSCTATNQSYDSAGAPATSGAPVTWGLDIQQPSAMVATFSKIKGVKCGKVREREKIPAHWVKVRRHGKLVSVKRRARTIVRKVTRCHAQMVVKKVCHAGHCTKRRVPVLPHTVQLSKLRVGYGKNAAVSGWLLASNGDALAGQPVSIMTTPDNGSNAFTQTATATTGPYGTWTAELPPGPGRLVEAVYGGTSTIASTTSGELQLVVPAKVKLLSVSPSRVAWGHTVRITGQLLGGYLPAGGVNVRLRYGFGRARGTYGVHEYVTGNGRFSTTYTFGAGYPGVHRRYWFAIASLPSGNYPYAPATSGRKYVTVGGHLHAARTHHHKSKHHKRKKHRRK